MGNETTAHIFGKILGYLHRAKAEQGPKEEKTQKVASEEQLLHAGMIKELMTEIGRFIVNNGEELTGSLVLVDCQLSDNKRYHLTVNVKPQTAGGIAGKITVTEQDIVVNEKGRKQWPSIWSVSFHPNGQTMLAFPTKSYPDHEKFGLTAEVPTSLDPKATFSSDNTFAFASGEERYIQGPISDFTPEAQTFIINKLKSVIRVITPTNQLEAQG